LSEFVNERLYLLFNTSVVFVSVQVSSSIGWEALRNNSFYLKTIAGAFAMF